MFYINNVDIFTLFHRDQYMIFVLIQNQFVHLVTPMLNPK